MEDGERPMEVRQKWQQDIYDSLLKSLPGSNSWNKFTHDDNADPEVLKNLIITKLTPGMEQWKVFENLVSRSW